MSRGYEITPPSASAADTATLKAQAKLEGRQLRLRIAIQTLRDKREQFKDLGELEVVWSAIDAL